MELKLRRTSSLPFAKHERPRTGSGDHTPAAVPFLVEQVLRDSQCCKTTIRVQYDFAGRSALNFRQRLTRLASQRPSPDHVILLDTRSTAKHAAGRCEQK